MSTAARLEALETAGLLHQQPDAVTAQLFATGNRFFLAADKVQVKYEMLRAHLVDGVSVTEAARSHGYSRPSFYVAQQAFTDSGMAGLLDDRPGRRGPLKLTGEIVSFLLAAPVDLSGAALAEQVEQRFGVELHRRTVERARRP
ncbi:MAG: helix-turn-helix domain-containing protein [Acidimicrobiales bacterium]